MDKFKNKMAADTLSISFNKVFSRIVYTDSFRHAPLPIFVSVIFFQLEFRIIKIGPQLLDEADPRRRKLCF